MMAFLSRDDLLRSAQMKRAYALLFLIESRVARLAARDQQIEAWLAAPVWGDAAPISSLPLPLDEVLPDEEDLLKPFADARSPRPRPRVRQIERYAPEWASLVPENSRLRAAVAHLLGEKYGKIPRKAAGIRAALGLDQETVQHAYQALFGAPLETLYAAEITLSERLQWAWATLGRWLARVPAFWFAFAFTLTETVGAGILALPIAMAKAGPLAGAAILVFLGAINVVTVACMAEAAARSDVIRCGDGFLGRLVADYLGRTGSLVFTAGGATLSLLWLQVYYAGFTSFMAEAFPLPPPVWAGVLFAACLYFATRPSLRSTATSALVVGAVNLLLILALLTLAFGHLRPEHLRLGGLPLRNGEGFDASILQMVFGVGLAAYFGHFSVGNCARLVLRRDPTARGLIGGSATAQVVAMVLYTLFVIGTSGASDPGRSPTIPERPSSPWPESPDRRFWSWARPTPRWRWGWPQSTTLSASSTWFWSAFPSTAPSRHRLPMEAGA